MKRNSSICSKILGIVLISMLCIENSLSQSTDESISDTSEYSIVFNSDESRAYTDIFILEMQDNQDSEITILVENALSKFPVFSPIDPILAFVSIHEDQYDIYMINFQESTLINLTENQNEEVFPRWSPDGSKIAYATFVDDNWEIYVMNLDDFSVNNITNQPESDEGRWGVDWSPDGGQIVFTSDRDINVGLYMMDSDGNNQTYLLPTPPFDDTFPIWSPSGDKIAFSAFRGQGSGIYLVDTDSQNMQLFLSTNEIPSSLSWSPDGSQILYILCRGRVNTCDINRVNISDGISHPVTQNNRAELYASWILTDRIVDFQIPFILSAGLEE